MARLGYGKGYYFNKQLKKFQVDVVRNGKHFYLALFSDETEAARVAAQAQSASPEELTALKEKYCRRPRERSNGRHRLPVDGAPVTTSGLEELEAIAAAKCAPKKTSELNTLLQVAVDAQQIYDQARNQCQALQKEAIRAWSVFDEALRKVREVEAQS